MGKQEPTQKEVFEALVEAIQYGMRKVVERDEAKDEGRAKMSKPKTQRTEQQMSYKSFCPSCGGLTEVIQCIDGTVEECRDISCPWCRDNGQEQDRYREDKTDAQGQRLSSMADKMGGAAL